MKSTKFRWISLVGMALCLILTIVMVTKVNNQDMYYEEVEAKIVSTEKNRVKKRYTYEVVVEYKDKKYELKNVYAEEFSRYQMNRGNYVTVYFANDKMYSNIAGIKTDGIEYYIYLGALLSTIVFLVWHIVCVKDIVSKGKSQ